jgi:DNA-binding LytR/AlgR family response regulator
MRIAIVDDLSADAEKLREFICRWAQEQGIFLVPAPVVFESGEALLAGFALDSFDVIFLDIYMSGMTGMEAAKKIREQDYACQLIFTTATREFAVDSYDVAAAFYLVKPYSYEKLAQALTRCDAELLEQKQCVMVPGTAGQQPLLLHQITHTEYYGRCVEVHLTSGEKLTVPMRQADFTALLLAYPYFCDCTRGVLVNLEQAENLLADRFLLKNGTSVPVSRLKYQKVREQFLTFTYAQMRGGH